MRAVIIVLLVHIIVCMAVMMTKRREKELVLENLMPIVIMVPAFGALCFLLRLLEGRHRRLGKRKIGLEQGDVMTGQYMQIRANGDEGRELVPLEEALLVNNTKVCHSIMLGILCGHPDEHIEMLQRAGNGDDMEVTHYATTMMMELLTQYEKKIQEYDRSYQENPNQELLGKYIGCLYELISARLVEGDIEHVYRKRLAKLTEQYENKPEKVLFISIENNLMLGENERAYEQLKTAYRTHPDQEQVHWLLGQYFDNIRDHHSFEKMARHLRDDHIYLSHEGREWLAFWS